MERLAVIILRMIIGLLKVILHAFFIVLFFIGITIGGLFLVQNRITEKKEVKIKENSYLVMDFEKGIKEKERENIFEIKPGIRLYPSLKAIETATKDKKVKGIIIDLDNVNISTTHIEEIGKKLELFKKSGKKVYAYGRSMNNLNYILASYANEIIMTPSHSTTAMLTGYYREFPYYKGLTDKMGITYNVIHVGDYKAMGENYVREKMSPEYKENITALFDERYKERINLLAKNRKLDSKTLNSLILSGNLAATDAFKLKENKLIDKLENYEKFKAQNKIENLVDFGEYTRGLSKKKKSGDKIGVIYAEGTIYYDSKSERAILPKKLIKELDKASKDKSVKGVVLRVDSPGGSALASEIIYQSLKEFKKPLYVSMGSVAASGGYYISSAGEKIFASDSTITGSIGVVSLIPNFEEASKKLDINFEKLEKGKFSGIYSVMDKMDSSEREKIMDSSEKVYGEFKSRILENRKNLNESSLEKIAGGRIWTAKKAKENGLVDEIGGLEVAIEALAKDKGIKEYTVFEYKESKEVGEYFNDITTLKMILDNPVSLLENKIKLPFYKPLMYMSLETGEIK